MKRFRLVFVAIVSAFETAQGHGYLTTPRSRNLLAFEETVWWPITENDPQPETCPHCLNRGGSLAQCGVSQESRNYDTPLNALGDPMPINQQQTYSQGQDIIIDVTLTAHHKGHFEFAACPISDGEKPTKECFEQNKLTFVEDLIYGANYDQNYPHRAYIAPVNVPENEAYVPNYGTTEGLMDFSFKMRLPPNIYGDLVLIQWYYLTANSCIHDGYAEYNWPAGWRDDSMSASLCGEVSSDGNGAPEQFWNCAETRILADSNTQQTVITSSLTNQPINAPTVSVQTSSVAIPVGLPSSMSSSLETTPMLSSGASHGKTIVGYYASWQWYDRNKLAAPENMDFTKVQRVNYAFFQTDTSGNIWGTDSWGDPNVLFGPYDWNPSDSSKQFCSWDSPTDRPCNYHKYEQGLIHLVHAAGAELYPSLGGWTLSDPFPAMAANPTARANFAKNCVELIKAYDFDGIDIDWEYPGFLEHSGTVNDKESFRLLLDEVRAELDELGAQTGRFYGLTAALPCGPSHIANMDIAHVASTLSELNLMTYDFHGAFSVTTGSNAPLYYQGWGEEGFSVHDCVENWLAGGGTKDKINIGLPFYGRSFAGATGLNEPHNGADQVVWGIDDGTPQYFNIMAQLPSMNHIWDKTTWTDWASFNSGGSVSFDSENAICAKTNYAIENGLNGFIIWELSGDVMSDLSTPLLDIVNKKLASPAYSCGELGYYPEEGDSTLVLAQPSSVDATGTQPAYDTVLSPGSSPSQSGFVPAASPNYFPTVTNPKNPEFPSLILNCKDHNSTDPKSIDLLFRYELHRYPSVSATAAVLDVKTSMLNDIGRTFQCQNTPSNSAGRNLSKLRSNPSIADYVVAVFSPSIDTPHDAPCSVAVNLDSTSVCDSMLGSLTVSLDSKTPSHIVDSILETIIFTIRTGMAVDRYITSKVLKSIFIEDLTADQLQATSKAVWTPESTQANTAIIIVVVVCVLVLVLTLTIQLIFFKRSKRSIPIEANNAEESIASSISHVEDVWQKALETYDSRGGVDPPVDGYAVTVGTDNSSEDNISDAPGEVELSNKSDPPSSKSEDEMDEDEQSEPDSDKGEQDEN